jgi:hypothetical protein
MMVFTGPHGRHLHQTSEASRRQGTETNRHGTVSKVEEKDGERKALVIWGYDPKGKPLEVYASSQEQRSGQHRSQDAVKPGQNVSLQGSNLRQATFTAQAEAKHAPQPKHAPEINGRSQSIGKKLRLAYHGGQDDDDQQQQGASGGSGGGSSGGGQQKQEYEKEHYTASWIAKEEEKLAKWKPQDGKPTSSKTGSQDSMSGKEQPQEQKQEEKEEERAMQCVMHEKEGFTNVIGKGDDAVRSAVHPKGSKLVAGKDNFMVLEKDKKALFQGKEDVHVRSEDKNLYAYGKENCYVNKQWVIKEKKEKDPVPNHDLKGKSKGGGGGGGGGSATA